MFCRLSSDVKFWLMAILTSGLVLLWMYIGTYLTHRSKNAPPSQAPSHPSSACRATVTITITVAPTTSTVMGRM
ncbi:hypothetical protein QBC32DRAFT_356610 [Pseudoneurospora amorphoporcata]|uniref:Uncharacterized protein n=1 Tax=Pseudoneurospora amorphoporcata TaxID=241081 RepID=A0AAN6NKH5_9PEZI|nr:hypothetical protein QBC32DRAFT_356610 [Pseudoneurospora amorphoporcata]